MCIEVSQQVIIYYLQHMYQSINTTYKNIFRCNMHLVLYVRIYAKHKIIKYYQIGCKISGTGCTVYIVQARSIGSKGVNTRKIPKRAFDQNNM